MHISLWLNSLPQNFYCFQPNRTAQLDPQTGIGHIKTSHQVLNIEDILAKGLFRLGDPLRKATPALESAQSFAANAMLTRKHLIGAFTIYRQQARPFDDQLLQLERMLADQRVIAIKNASIVSELRSKD